MPTVENCPVLLVMLLLNTNEKHCGVSYQQEGDISLQFLV